MFEALKTGDWLTPARLRIYPALMLALCLMALAFLLATSHGNLDNAGRPLGTDFSEVWIAGQSVQEGHAADAYNLKRHQTRQDEYFGGAEQGTYLFSYPPVFLAIAAALALLPYLGALALWQGTTLCLYLAACVAAFGNASPASVSRKTILFAALSFPAVFVTLVHGQNGFLSAALLTAGLLVLDKRPMLAGMLFACLAFKPQYAVLVPFALLAARQGRAILSGAATLVALLLASLCLFGASVWLGFFDGLTLARHLVLDEGGAGYEKMQSLFAAARLLGAPLPLAYGVQAAGTIAVAAAIVWLWASQADSRLKGAALLCGSLLATPYGFDYDLVILGPALAMLTSLGLAQGFQPFQKSLLFGLWLMPLVARPLMTATSLPLSCLMLVTMFAAILYWARVSCGTSNLGHSGLTNVKIPFGTFFRSVPFMHQTIAKPFAIAKASAPRLNRNSRCDSSQAS